MQKTMLLKNDAQAPMNMCEEILHEKEDENNGLKEFNEDMSCMQLPTNGNGGEGLSDLKRKGLRRVLKITSPT
jgi:hypothetical protein